MKNLKVNVNTVFKQKWQAQWNVCPDKTFFQISLVLKIFMLEWEKNNYYTNLYRTRLFYTQLSVKR